MPNFVGDRQSKLVHDLLSFVDDCAVIDIDSSSSVYFTNLDDAVNLGFSGCPNCLGGP